MQNGIPKLVSNYTTNPLLDLDEHVRESPNQVMIAPSPMSVTTWIGYIRFLTQVYTYESLLTWS